MSQQESHVTEIDGHKFVMFMIPPRRSNRLLVSVFKMIGPSAGPILDSLVSLSQGKGFANALNQDIDSSEFFGKSFKLLFNELNEDLIDKVIDALGEFTHADNTLLTGPVIDVFFSGKLDLMYKWLFWGIKVQWGKSLSALVESVKDQGAIAKTLYQSPSPTT